MLVGPVFAGLGLTGDGLLTRRANPQKPPVASPNARTRPRLNSRDTPRARGRPIPWRRSRSGPGRITRVPAATRRPNKGAAPPLDGRAPPSTPNGGTITQTSSGEAGAAQRG